MVARSQPLSFAPLVAGLPVAIPTTMVETTRMKPKPPPSRGETERILSHV
jgi:hypothetical protein